MVDPIPALNVPSETFGCCRKCYICTFQQSMLAIQSDLILKVTSLQICCSCVSWNTSAMKPLEGGLSVLLYTWGLLFLPRATSHCFGITSFIFSQHHHPDNTWHNSIGIPLLPWGPFLTRCLTTASSSTLTEQQWSPSKHRPLKLSSVDLYCFIHDCLGAT